MVSGRKSTKEEIIILFESIHGNKYDYSKIDYIGSHNKIEIICKKHGSFLQSPNNHSHGSGCPTCGATKTFDNFLKDARNKHGNKYDYSKVVYINAHTKVEIICPKHGSFFQIPNSHIRYDCIKCGHDKNRKNDK